MKTNDLIRALSADSMPGVPSVNHAIARAMLAGLLIAAAVFLLALGLRPDIGEAAATLRFPFKFVVTLALVVTAASLLVRLARPDASPAQQLRLLWVGPTLLLGGVLIELFMLPFSLWQGSLVGSNAAICLTAIPLLSIAPLAALLWALRHGAPVRPRLAGAICGLLSASLAATLYALHCTDDSPLFVAVWYSLAIGAVTVVAAGLGGRYLRW